ncbi:hypothetical protein F5Y09DRAFT_356050 [Xylaria sp. FL1042]|nr:hypothetical protein F5Y09DRAFT_356050 [Xylaria sp. FL1042]
MAVPEATSSSSTYKQASTQSVPANTNSGSFPIEYFGLDMNGQAESTERRNEDNIMSGGHSSLGRHNTSSLPEASASSMSMPSTRSSLDQLPQSIDCGTPDLQVSPLIQDDDAANVLEHSVPSSSIEAATGLSTTSTQVPSPSSPITRRGSDSASPLPIRESLGFSGLASLAGGHIGILGVLGFLFFLWFGFGPAPEAAKATSAWRHIVLANWMTRAITLSSLAIRILTTFQATVCTSMAAALILERRRARKSYVPWFSVIRSINDGPWRLVQMLLSSRSLSIIHYPEFWLAALMVLVTLALQFSSTVLLSDLKPFAIVSDYNHTQVPSLITYDKSTFDIQLNGGQYLLTDPVFSTFGEVHSVSDPSPNDHGLSDTGLLQRGFLPFKDSQNRTSTRRYDGNAIVMSSRAACMRPSILGQYGYSDDSGNFVGNGFLEGEIQYTSSFHDAQVTSIPPCETGECDSEPFSCAIPSSTYGDWEAGACSLSRFGLSPRGLTLQPKWNSSNTAWSANSTAYLVQTTNMRDTDWAQAPGIISLPTGLPYHEWQSYELLPGRFLNVTLCFAGMALERKAITMDSSGNLREPVINGSKLSKEYNTADVQKLFGVDGVRRSVAERGILDMMIVGEPNDGPATSPAYETISVGDATNITISKFTSAVLELVLYAQSVEVVGRNETLPFCSFCSIASEALLDPRMGMILNDITTQSGRAANTLLTYLSIVASAVYYDYLEALVDLQDASTISTIGVMVPGPCSVHGCQGFISVIVLLIVHLLYVTVITFLYIKQSRHSRYANIWHAISQLVSGELKETWDESTNTSDAAVTKSIRRDGKDYFLKLGQLDAQYRIGFLNDDTMTKLEQGAEVTKSKRLARLLWLKVRLPWAQSQG